MVAQVLKVLRVLQKQGSAQHGTGDKPASAQQQPESVHRAVYISMYGYINTHTN